MTFGEDWGWGATAEVSRAQFEAYVEAGGNFIDTASNYTNGTSETLVGEFSEPIRERMVLATKYTLNTATQDPNAGGNHRKNLVQSVERSLRRLRTDYIDLLYLHVWDMITPLDDVASALNDVVRTGKVLHVAISDTPAWVIARLNAIAELRGWARPVAVQVPYNVSRRDVEHEIWPMAQAHGLPLIAWGALGGGMLTGKYTSGETGPRRYGDAAPSERTARIAEAVQDAARESGHSPAQVALAWVRSGARASRVIPIVGARTVEQLRANLAVADIELPAEIVAKLDEAGAPIPIFPRSFMEDAEVLELIFGKTRPLLDV
jgi:aryl-alcohol dehydrogenase-like predicted oxidoreductase